MPDLRAAAEPEPSQLLRLEVLRRLVEPALCAAIGVRAARCSVRLPLFTCGTVSGGSATTFAHVTAVRVGHGPGYDRFVVQFDGSRVPTYKVIPKSGAVLWLDPSNVRVQLLGTAGIKVVLFAASGFGSYVGPTGFRTGFPQLLEAATPRGTRPGGSGWTSPASGYSPCRRRHAW
jgi:hypothetical protein